MRRSAAPRIEGFHHVNLSVPDAERSATWYADLFGFKRTKEIPDDGKRGAKIILWHPHAAVYLGFTTHRRNRGERFSELRTGMDHFAFAVPSESALVQWESRLRAREVSHSRSEISPLITIRDPDNIQLQVYAEAL